MTDQGLREKIAATFIAWMDKCEWDCDLMKFEAKNGLADRILAIPELREALELKALVDAQQGKSVTDAVLETQRSKLGHSISTNTKRVE